MNNMRPRGFTLVETVVVIAVVLLVLGAVLLLSAGNFFGGRRAPHRQLQNATQLRGIHQGMVIYAQGNKVGGATGYFPGLDASGYPLDVTVEHRFQVLLEADAFTPEYLINPDDVSKVAWDPKAGVPLISGNYSYAILDISEPGGRREEWAETLNTQAIVLSDRNIGSDADAKVQSIWSDPGEWRGNVVRNDNSTSFELDVGDFETRYGSSKVINLGDNLFASPGTDDALMIHSGE